MKEEISLRLDKAVKKEISKAIKKFKIRNLKMDENKADEKEERALDALIVAALRAPELQKEVTEEDIEKFLSEDMELSKKDEEVLEALGDDFWAIIEKKKD